MGVTRFGTPRAQVQDTRLAFNPPPRWMTLMPSSSGLRVRSEIDTNAYPKGLVVSHADFSTIDIESSEFHGEWNYSIQPHLK